LYFNIFNINIFSFFIKTFGKKKSFKNLFYVFNSFNRNVRMTFIQQKNHFDSSFSYPFEATE